MFSRARYLAYGIAFLATPAFSQTTPEDFLKEIESLMASVGYTMEVGSQSMEGETLVLRDIGYSFETPQFRGKVLADEWRIAPTDEAGYELVLTASDVQRITFEAVDPAMAGALPDGMSYETPGNRLLVGGTPEERQFAYTADAARMTFAMEIPEGAGGTFDMTFEIAEIAAEGGIESGFFGEGFAFTGTAASAMMDYDITGPDGTLNMDITYADLGLDTAGPMVNFADPASMFSSGRPMGFGFTFASSNTTTAFEEFGSSAMMIVSTGPGDFVGLFGGGGLDYTASATDTVVAISGDEMPFPSAEMKIAKSDFRFAMPLMPSNKPGTLALGLGLEGLTLSEEIWSLFDPGATLPRDPADVIVKLSGEASALVNFMDPEAMAATPPMGMPYEFHNVKIDELAIRLAGAEITATGAADINNAGIMPMPVGGLDISLNGLLTLSEKLQALGLLPPPQAAMLPGMLQAFAKPGDGPDSFTSRIEMGADGSITANGMPLQ